MKKGIVYLVGAGPGDPRLLTEKGKQLLKTADVVIYDRLVGPGILSMIPEGIETVNVGKTAGNHPVPQENINQILLEYAKQGLKVVRLKGGDPFVFGRGGEELELLTEADIPFEIVPGISSAIAAPAYAGIPVTHRDFASSIHIITAHRKRGDHSLPDFYTLAKLNGTLIFLMGVSSLPAICSGLIQAGMDADTPAAIIEQGTTARQKSVVADLRTLPQQAETQSIQSPAVIIVGEVCKLAKRFHWSEDRPLGKTRILITRPRNRMSSFAQKLEHLGAEVIQMPCIQTIPLLPNPLETELEQIHRYQWIVFTSAAGAEVFWEQLRQTKTDIRSLQSIHFAAIGPATKESIESHGIIVDYMPSVYTSSALANGLLEQLDLSDRILLPRSSIGTQEITQIWDNHHISYTDCPIYDTVYPNQNEIPVFDFDYAAFTSASTVEGFVKAMKTMDFTAVHAVCIGEQTAKTARQYGMKTTVSEHATIDSMVDTILSITK
jgi:uroporphyrinogen III methyltransferase/synthase